MERFENRHTKAGLRQGLIAAACVALLWLTPAAARAVIIKLEQTFDDPAISSADQFGFSVAIDGNRALVAAPYHHTPSPDVGQVHLFTTNTGSLLQTFDDPTVSPTDRFGLSVAMDDDNVLIGAPFDDTAGSEVGQAHLFSATTGSLLQTFDDPTITTQDRFGFSVAVNGNNVLIGVPGDDTAGSGVGQAHLFNATTGSLLQTFDDPSATTSDGFGLSVAISGNYALVGAPFDDSNAMNAGQAYLFNATTGGFLQAFDAPFPFVNDEFGRAVAIDGENVLIGAPANNSAGFNVGQVYLFNAITGSLAQTFNDPTVTTQDRFGSSVAIDGRYALIGAPFDNTYGSFVGQAHLFDIITGNLLYTFDDPTVTTEDQFGWSVALSGGNILIGAKLDDTYGANIGQAHLFSFSIPEPSSLTLAVLCVMTLSASGRRRRRRDKRNTCPVPTGFTCQAGSSFGKALA